MEKNANRSKMKGFTLLEVLIATVIFVIVMVITSGIISQSVDFQSKIKVTRDVTEEGSRLSDYLSRDLRSAGVPFKASLTSSGATTIEFKNGVALLRCSAVSVCVFADNVTPTNISSDPINAYTANVVIISSKDSDGNHIFKFFYSPSGSGKVSYLTSSESALSAMTMYFYYNGVLHLQSSVGSANFLLDRVTALAANQISGDKLETRIGFSGYTNSDATGAKNYQSYITYYVYSRSKNFGSLRPAQRAETSIRSMITMRSYTQ